MWRSRIARRVASVFTGIVISRGVVRETLTIDGDLRVRIQAMDTELETSKEGDSISVSGTCLTMLKPEKDCFWADVSAETLALTTLGTLQAERRVNLELAMTLTDRLGGHLVTGHVDGMAELVSRESDARAERFEFEVPVGLEKYVARKGSICIDGVSLTVNAVEGRRFSVCLIPHTLAVTTLGELLPSDSVNIEVDLLARYVERLAISEIDG
jgi:riboflavin synthase